jgi:hypothetical protein
MFVVQKGVSIYPNQQIDLSSKALFARCLDQISSGT